MVNKYFDGVIPSALDLNDVDKELISSINELPKIVDSKMNSYHISDAIEAIFNVLSKCNKYIDDTTPWVLAKDDSNRERLGTVMYNLLDGIRVCTILLRAFIPDTTEKVFKQINTKNIEFSDAIYGKLESNIHVGEAQVLFERIG